MTFSLFMDSYNFIAKYGKGLEYIPMLVDTSNMMAGILRRVILDTL